MSTGEGWNASVGYNRVLWTRSLLTRHFVFVRYMHDYTMSYPRCTESTNYFESDCGSEGWAFALFISWDVLSQFLLVNMLTGVVVESFSYVFAAPGKAALNREDIRESFFVLSHFPVATVSLTGAVCALQACSRRRGPSLTEIGRAT